LAKVFRLWQSVAAQNLETDFDRLWWFLFERQRYNFFIYYQNI